tara:strand:- start:1260 stop:1706 length:447 start_codon:yes stop_codon:yes gene_type:complete
MKKSELKKILKPLVQECIKESLLEDGLISGIIAEVVRGINSPQPIVEAVAPVEDVEMKRMKISAFGQTQRNKLRGQRDKLMAAIDRDAYNGVNLFEGTTPAPAQGSPIAQASSMAGQSPEDSGVDISSLFESVGNQWNAHMSDTKQRK